MPYKKSYRRSGRTVKSSMPVSLMPRASGLSAGARALYKAQLAAKAKNYVARSTAKRISRIRRQKKKYEGTAGSAEREMFRMKTGKMISQPLIDKRLVRASREQFVYKFRGVKSFDDNGYFWCHNVTWTGFNARLLPVYAFLLNGCNQYSGWAQACQPARRLFVGVGATDGQLQWWNQTGLTSAGAGSQNLQEVYSTTGAANPGQKALLDYVHLKMNMWGSKQKAHRWTVQLIKVLDDEVSPFHSASGASLGTHAQQTWEEVIKQYTYNPISKLDWRTSSKIKVLKTFDRILQPTQTTEVDTDPKVCTLDWFMRFNRLTKFDDVNVADTGTLRMANQSVLTGNGEPTNSFQDPYSNKPRGRHQLILLVRASDYANPTYATENDANNNNVHPSFDIDFQTKFLGLE